MFHVDPDAWATVVGVMIVCVSLFVAVARKVQKKMSLNQKEFYFKEL